MKKILGMAFMLLLLTGCFGGKETTTVCKSDMYGEATIKAKGDEILTTEIVEVLDLGYDGTDEEAKEYVESMLSLYKVTGVTYEVEEVVDGVATVITIYDYEKADLEELAEMGLVESGADYISLEKTVEEYEKDGSCK